MLSFTCGSVNGARFRSLCQTHLSTLWPLQARAHFPTYINCCDLFAPFQLPAVNVNVALALFVASRHTYGRVWVKRDSVDWRWCTFTMEWRLTWKKLSISLPGNIHEEWCCQTFCVSSDASVLELVVAKYSVTTWCNSCLLSISPIHLK